MQVKEFKIGNFITLKLEKNRTNIYINGKKFIQYKFLLLEIPIKDSIKLNELGSIDEFSEQYGNPFDILPLKSLKVPPDAEFWGVCSNL